MSLFNQLSPPLTLRPQELEVVSAVSQAIARSISVDSALDEIIQLTRPVFIFDTMVLYLEVESGGLEASYARIIGRGKFAEGELAWGESVATEVVTKRKTVTRDEDFRREIQDETDQRLAHPFFLALPLYWGERLLGALVFGRFGGPAYSPDQIHFAEFISGLVSQLLGRQQLVDRVASLEAERKLDQLQQDFIATISHELCTPLGFIKGYATTLLRQDTTWDEVTRREFLSIIDEEADKLRELIDSLLDSSRLQSGTLHMQFQQIRLDSLLGDIAVRANSRYENLNLELVLKKGEVRCQADPTRLAQVLDNLISNAVKYAPGSELKLILDIDRDGRAHVMLSDKGPGIAPEHQQNIFKRFYRIPEHTSLARGTGLGLFICHEIIEAHHGDISVESEKGKGTTFHIYLDHLDKAPTANSEEGST